LRPDDDDNKAIYGKEATQEQILEGRVAPPESARSLISTLGRYSWREQ